MPTQICDRSPCDQMKLAIASVCRPNNRGDRFEIIAKLMPLNRHVIIPIRYCPFCGTRIDEQWVEELMKEM